MRVDARGGPASAKVSLSAMQRLAAKVGRAQVEVMDKLLAERAREFERAYGVNGGRR